MESGRTFALKKNVSNQRAFSVTELVLVILLIAILSLGAIPLFSDTKTYQAELFEKEIISTIRYARQLAIGTNSFISVNLTTTSIRLNQIAFSGCSIVSNEAIVDPMTHSKGYVRSVPSGVTLSYSSDWPIYFNVLGQALSVSDCTVRSTMTIGVDSRPVVTIYGETGFLE